MPVDVQIVGDDALVRKLFRMETRFMRDGQVLRNISDSQRRHNRRMFASEGAAPGQRRGRWAPLSPRYAALKRLEYGNQPILVATGGMRIRAVADPNEIERHLKGVSLGMVEMGVRGKVPFYHQHGTRRMPARPFITSPFTLQRQITRDTVDYVTGDLS